MVVSPLDFDTFFFGFGALTWAYGTTDIIPSLGFGISLKAGVKTGASGVAGSASVFC